MTGTSVFDGLLRPLSEAEPCGQSLEDTTVLAAFDAYQLFGQQLAIGSRRPGQKEDEPPTPPDWNEVLEKSTAALATSKDLRVLAYFGAAQLWTGGLVPFCETLRVAAGWLENWFDGVYPRSDGDIYFRTNALNNFNDRLAIVDAVRRAPLVSNRGTGPISLRHIELASGIVPVTKQDATPTKEGEISVAFATAPLADLRTEADAVKKALDSLTQIDTKMLAAGGLDATPNFDGHGDKEKLVSLRHQLKRIHEIVCAQIAARPDAAGRGRTVAAGFNLARRNPHARGCDPRARRRDHFFSEHRAIEPGAAVHRARQAAHCQEFSRRIAGHRAGCAQRSEGRRWHP